MFSSIAFCFFKASDIIEIYEIGDLNNFPILCWGRPSQVFNVHAFISDISVRLSMAHFKARFITANI